MLDGTADMTANITSTEVIQDLNVSTAVNSGNFTINGEIFTIDAATGGSGDFHLQGTVQNAIDAINAKTATTGVTASLETSGTDVRLVLESNSEIVLGHADDTSNFLGAMKLFSQSELNYREVGAAKYYSKTESTATTSTTNFYRTGEYAWDGTKYYQALKDVPRGTSLADTSYFGAGVTTSPVAQVDTISGLAADSKVAQVDTVSIVASGSIDGFATFSVTLTGSSSGTFTVTEGTDFMSADTADVIAAALAAKVSGVGINAAATGGSSGQLTLTSATAGTSFTVDSLTTTDASGSTINSSNTTPNVTGDTFTITIGSGTSVVISSGTSTNAVATDIRDAINSAFGATVTAVVNGSDEVEVTADVAGTAFTMLVGLTEGADGTVTATGISTTTTDNDPGSPDKFRSRSEFAIGSLNPTKSLKDTLGLNAATTYHVQINGQTFTIKDGADSSTGEIDMDTFSLQNFMDKVTASDADVTMSYNPVEDRFALTNKDTGKTNITAQDVDGTDLTTANTVTGGLLNLMKLFDNTDPSVGTLTKGNDATLTINGTIVSSNSNSVTGESHGINGLTVTIKDDFSSTDADITITVAGETSTARSAIDTFVSEYNMVQRHLTNVTQTTTTDDKVQTSVFSDNLEVTGLISSLRGAVFGGQYSVNPVTMKGTGIERLADIGIDFVTGSSQLQISDSSKLNTALSENGSQVKELFMSKSAEPAYYSSATTFSTGETTEHDGVIWVMINSSDITGVSPPSYDADKPSANTDGVNWAFYGYKDDVARRNNDSTTDWGNPTTSSTPILNGGAYGMAYRVKEFIENFTAGTTPDPDDTETEGTISIQTTALQDANDQLDEDIASLEQLLTQREQQMTNSFIRMEEMQSQLQGQMQMLQSSFQSNGLSGNKK